MLRGGLKASGVQVGVVLKAQLLKIRGLGELPNQSVRPLNPQTPTSSGSTEALKPKHHKQVASWPKPRLHCGSSLYVSSIIA